MNFARGDRALATLMHLKVPSLTFALVAAAAVTLLVWGDETGKHFPATEARTTPIASTAPRLHTIYYLVANQTQADQLAHNDEAAALEREFYNFPVPRTRNVILNSSRAATPIALSELDEAWLAGYRDFTIVDLLDWLE